MAREEGSRRLVTAEVSGFIWVMRKGMWALKSSLHAAVTQGGGHLGLARFGELYKR